MKRKTFVFAAALCAALLFSGCRKADSQVIAPVASAPSSQAASSQAAEASSQAVSSAQGGASSEADAEVSQPGSVESQGGIVKTVRTDSEKFNQLFSKNPLDQAYAAEMNNAISTVDMEKVSDKYAGLWEKEVIYAYAALKKNLASGSAEKWKQVEAGQKTWESGKAAALKKISDDAAAAGGTSARVQASSDAMEYYRARAAALYRMLYDVAPDYGYAYKK